MVDSHLKPCPLLMAASIIGPQKYYDKDETLKCKGHKCQWFVEVYTTEGFAVNDCALALLPRMNSEGQMRV